MNDNSYMWMLFIDLIMYEYTVDRRGVLNPASIFWLGKFKLDPN